MMHRSLLFVVIALCALPLSGCGGDRAKKQARRAELVALMHGNTADADIKAAIAKAKETTPQFIEALKSPRSNQSHFLARKAFPTKDAGKQQILIVNQLSYDGTLIHGVLDDNTAEQGSGVERSGKVSFKPEEICDWMFNEDGKAVGGWMLRALKKKMTEEEWAPYARQIEFKD